MHSDLMEKLQLLQVLIPGLGQGMSVALAQAGAKVVGVARRSCEDTKKLIEADGGEFTEVIAESFGYGSD